MQAHATALLVRMLHPLRGGATTHRARAFMPPGAGGFSVVVLG